MLVSFGINEVKAMITNLESTADNDPWSFNGRDVEQIDLKADITNDSFAAPSDGQAELTLDGSRFSPTAPGQFSGIFVGDSGDEVFGLWSITGKMAFRVHTVLSIGRLSEWTCRLLTVLVSS